MLTLQHHLAVNQCPFCGIDRPTLSVLQIGNNAFTVTTDYEKLNPRWWGVYKCSRCGGLITAAAAYQNANDAAVAPVTEIYPTKTEIAESIPSPARDYLAQAVNSLSAPAGAVMLCASSVDAMLKIKGYDDPKQSLYKRIEKAADDHLITVGMKDWAHEVRLDANNQRHADQASTLPTQADAQRSIEFAQALGQFLFVLPARVERGKAEAKATAEQQAPANTGL